MAVEVFILGISRLRGLTQKGETLFLRRCFSLTKAALTAHRTHSQAGDGDVVTAQLGKEDVSPHGKVPRGLLHPAVAQTDSGTLLAASCKEGDLSHRTPGPALTAMRAPHQIPHSPSGQGYTAPRNREQEQGKAHGPRGGQAQGAAPAVLPVGPAAAPWIRTTRGPHRPRTPGTATRPGTQREPRGRERRGRKRNGEPPYPNKHRTAPTPSTAAAGLAAFPTSAPPPTARGAPGHRVPCQPPQSGHNGGRTTTPGGQSGAERAGASLPLHLPRASWEL